MLQLSEKTESSLAKSIDSISKSVPKLSKVLDLEKSKETGVWSVEPKKIYVTINEPITVKAPKMITDGKEKDTSFIGDIKKALGMKPKSAEAMRLKAEEKQKKADARAKKRHDMMAGWFKDLGKSLKKSLTDNPVVNFIRDHWGKIMFAALALFLKPEQWKAIWQGIKDLWAWFKSDGIDILKGVWDVLKEWVPKIAEWIGDLIDNVFGKKATKDEFEAAERAGPREGETQEQFQARLDSMGSMKGGEFVANERQGGLFGAGETGPMGIIKGVLSGLTLLIGALALFGPAGSAGLAISAMIGTFKLFGKSVGNIAGGLSDTYNKITTRDAPKGSEARNKRAQKIREQRAANKAKFGDARGKQGLGSKIKKVGKVVAKRAGGAMATTAGGGASATPKPPKPSTAITKVGSKAAKWASKFPKLAKGMKFLTKLPGPVGKAFMVGPLIAALVGGAGKKEVIPMIGSILGGIGGGLLGSLLGGMVGLAGGPLALVTTALGGVAGALLGDSLATGLAQWLVGDKVDALPFGFGWLEDLINEGKMQEGGELSPEAGGSKVGGSAPTPKPMTKNQFLQSEKYKGQMRGADGVVAGESTAGQQTAYEEYLKEEEKAPIIKESVKKIKGDIKTAKRLPKSIRNKRLSRINKFLDASPNGEAILSQLKPRELKLLGRSTGEAEESSATVTNKSITPKSSVSPMMKADTLNQVQGENAELSSGGNAVVAPTVINNYYNSSGGGENGTAIYGVPTAQKGQQHRHSNIR